MIEIDGSYLKSGGQILKTATVLSAITKRPCCVFNVSLTQQHLLGLQALNQLCSGRLEGDELGSQKISFYPCEIKAGLTAINVKIDAAESIALILQSLILPALFGPNPIKITFRGGATDTFFSPTMDYFQNVFLKILEKMGGKVEINIINRGYYPEGQAQVKVIVYPSKLKNLDLTERGQFKQVLAISGASELLQNKKVAERQLAGAKEVLGKLQLETEEKISYYPSQSPGNQICLAAIFENTVIGTDNLGKLDKRAEDVGKEAASELLKEQKSQACLDKHLADQILPYLALASGNSNITVSEITRNCQANIWVIEKFLNGKFKTKDNLITWNK